MNISQHITFFYHLIIFQKLQVKIKLTSVFISQVHDNYLLKQSLKFHATTENEQCNNLYKLHVYILFSTENKFRLTSTKSVLLNIVGKYQNMTESEIVIIALDV